MLRAVKYITINTTFFWLLLLDCMTIIFVFLSHFFICILIFQNFHHFCQSPQIHSAVLGFDCSYVYMQHVEGKVPIGFIYCAKADTSMQQFFVQTNIQTMSSLGCEISTVLLSPYSMNDTEYLSQPIPQVPLYQGIHKVVCANSLELLKVYLPFV